jgi:hypothetical protein
VLPAAESVAQSAEFAYTKGATGVLDLLDARRALRQTRVDAVDVQGNFAKAWRRTAPPCRPPIPISTSFPGSNRCIASLICRSSPAIPASPAPAPRGWRPCCHCAS